MIFEIYKLDNLEVVSYTVDTKKISKLTPEGKVFREFTSVELMIKHINLLLKGEGRFNWNYTTKYNIKEFEQFKKENIEYFI